MLSMRLAVFGMSWPDLMTPFRSGERVTSGQYLERTVHAGDALESATHPA